jgi:hypothetical protein
VCTTVYCMYSMYVCCVRLLAPRRYQSAAGLICTITRDLPFGMPRNFKMFDCFFKRRNHMRSNIAGTIRESEPEESVLKFQPHYEIHDVPRAASVFAYSTVYCCAVNSPIYTYRPTHPTGLNHFVMSTLTTTRAGLDPTPTTPH